jgi:integrase
MIRSAVSTVIGLHTGVFLGQSKISSMLIRGLRKQNLKTSKYHTIWDRKILDDYFVSLGNNKTLSYVTLVGKMGCLFLMDYFLRFTEMVGIRISSIRFEANGTDIRLSTVLKTTQEVISNLKLNNDSNSHKHHLADVVVEVLTRLKHAFPQDYINLPLFYDILQNRPILVEALRVVVKTIMDDAGIDTESFSSYSLKAAGASALHRKGYPLSQIRQLARLSPKTTTLQRFYLKPLEGVM